MLLADGTRLHPKRKYLLQPGQEVTLRLPGGGGHGLAFERDPRLVLEDVRQGRVSESSARDDYGVAIDMAAGIVLEEETERLRAQPPPETTPVSQDLPADSYTDVLAAFPSPPSPSAECGTAEELVAWQRRFRTDLEALRGWLPDRVEPALEVLSEVDAGDHIRQTVRVAVSDITSVVGYLLTPADDETGPRPGLVALHGHYRHGIDTISGVRNDVADPANDLRHAYALHAVRAGYVVIVPALWGWPGRDGHLERVGHRDRCNTIQMASAMYGANPVDLHIQDAQAALDMLATHPGVDSGRLGCLGNSTGGRMTMWLTIFDERIRACVPSGCMNTFRERSQKLSSCGIQYPFGLLQHGDVPDLFSLIAPRPMQLQAGEGDTLITPADRDAMGDHMARVYGLLAAPDQLQYVLHDGGHLLDWPQAAPFLQRHLGDRSRR
jgi:dienelactone hydrolase